MAQVKDIGTGFMMIAKSVIHKMIAKYPETKYRNNVAGYGNAVMNDCFYTLFDCCIDPVSKVYLSEDYLFCKRWIDMGGELWLDLNTNLNHTGIIDYKGCLAMTIGEVDTLNKDAQIMRAQAEKEKAAAGNGVNTGASVSGESPNKKKKNKKNKKKKTQAAVNDNKESKECNDKSSDDEENNDYSCENKLEVEKKDSKDEKNENEKELNHKMAEGSHC
jgi:flagellar biosynthesis GTPase FlhF